ncbi:hypothetical protein ACFL6S_28145 [Candidatus Poribacteria bacterium]
MIEVIYLLQCKMRKSDGRNAQKLVLLCLGTLSLAFLAIAPCNGQEAEIESVIPAYSVAYVAVKDVPGIWDTVKESSSWQSVLSFNELLDRTQDLMGRTEEFLGVDLRTLVGIFGSRMALVQVYMDMDGPTPPAIVADVGDSEDAAEIIQKIERALDSDEEYEVRSPAGTYQTIPFASIRRVGEEPAIRYAFLNNLFVIAFEQDTFEAILDVYLGDDPSLIYDPRYNRTRAGISVDGEVFVYINMELMWPIAWSSWLSEPGMLLRMLGADDIKSIAWTTGLVAPTKNQQAYFYTGDSRELITSLFAEHDSLLSPHIIPASSADIFLAMNLGDPVTAWERFGDAVRNVIGEEEHSQMQDAVTKFERETALSLEDDILSSLTGEIGLAMPAPGIMKLRAGSEYLMEEGLVMFCGVRDREQCATSIERILLTEGLHIQQTEYGGGTIYHNPAQSGSDVPLGYAFAGDLLVYGSVQALQSIIDGDMPLVVSEKFADISSQLSKRLGLMYYTDLEQIGGLLMGANPDAQSGDDMMRLQTLGSTGGTLLYDGEGLKAESVGTSAKSWLETTGILAELFVYTLF